MLKRERSSRFYFLVFYIIRAVYIRGRNLFFMFGGVWLNKQVRISLFVSLFEGLFAQCGITLHIVFMRTPTRIEDPSLNS